MSQTTSLGLTRLFTKDSKAKAYDLLKWQRRDSVITNPMTGKAVLNSMI